MQIPSMNRMMPTYYASRYAISSFDSVFHDEQSLEVKICVSNYSMGYCRSAQHVLKQFLLLLTKGGYRPRSSLVFPLAGSRYECAPCCWTEALLEFCSGMVLSTKFYN